MQASTGGHVVDMDDIIRGQIELRRSLYRFDCPNALTLGESQLDLLEPPPQARVTNHAAECDECRAELRLMRQFLAEPIRQLGMTAALVLH